MPNNKPPKKPSSKRDESEIIWYAVGNIPKPRKRRIFRDIRGKSAELVRKIYAYGKEMGMKKKIGCSVILVLIILLITAFLAIFVGFPGSGTDT